MKLTSIQVFKLMYCALDDLWSNNKDDKLAIYLSEANPFICEEGSADPVVYNDFKQYFGEEQELYDYGYECITDYLRKLDSFYGDILSLFLMISLDEYQKKAIYNLSLSEEQLKQQHI